MIYISNPSTIFDEHLLVPRLTTENCIPSNIIIKTQLTRSSSGTTGMTLNIPIVSSIMQSVSDDKLSIALAKAGGLSFIYCSQSIEDQVKMIERVKKYKAGFVISDSNLKISNTLKDVLDILKKTGHSTMPVTENGLPNGKFLGLVTSRDYREGYTTEDTKVHEFMTPLDKIVLAYEEKGIDLSTANTMMFENKLNVLPIIDKDGNLKSLVFRRDHKSHSANKDEMLDSKKRYMVGAGVNTHDYEERIPRLVEAGADVLCIDSSDGYTVWQQKVISFVKSKYGDIVKIGSGNVVDAEGFTFLADAGADFIKVGIGGGSICITREQKGIGCGQATAVMDVAKARDEYFKTNGEYIPICSDGGITKDNHVTLALAMGADFVMMGRYFARFDESPGTKISQDGKYLKEYWGEGSNRARNWQRYEAGEKGLLFEEGVNSYVPYAGSLKENVYVLTSIIKSTMCNCGCIDIDELHKNAKIRPVSIATISEGSAHDVIVRK